MRACVSVSACLCVCLCAYEQTALSVRACVSARVCGSVYEPVFVHVNMHTMTVCVYV